MVLLIVSCHLPSHFYKDNCDSDLKKKCTSDFIKYRIPEKFYTLNSENMQEFHKIAQ